MEMNDKYAIQIGDWVRAKSSKGGLIHGFVEKNELDHNVIQLRVVASDNKMLTGQSIQINQSKIDRLSSEFSKTENQIHVLIDMALETHDEDWFNDLVAQLNQLKKQKDADMPHVNYKSNRCQTDHRS
ncbi:IDEAL domain protein [Paraliobacillus sp. PM-2]|uniref:IDEAL domain-containing protein n=1 Tax=Paraliobacillus sp. PM-2 TaxID=1462524 RepID=UPI00061BFF08|nr:IDEAL domain-containing protein [Paraliobacillus sp. PM-2]CQR47562.1 IDEAL domain protein [Paraliobacillus sp. PM-2]